MKKSSLFFIVMLMSQNWLVAQVVIKEVGFSQRGKAAYYPDNRKGAETRNGETYNMNHLTGAHQHLAFNSLVKVTNLDNGKQVIVRINDRPYTRERIIDLTYAAASFIGLAGKLSADVKIEVVAVDGDRKQTWIENQKLGFSIPDSLSYLLATPKPLVTLQNKSSVASESVQQQVPQEAADLSTGNRTQIQEVQNEVDIEVVNTLAQKITFKEVGSYTVGGKKISLNGFGVMVAAFTNPEEAVETGKHYQSLQFTHVHIQSGWATGIKEYRVMIGLFNSKIEAVPLQKHLSTNSPSVMIRSHLN